MCGIFGLYFSHVDSNRHEILKLLLSGLRRLEYHGYDSAGLAIDLPTDEVGVVKSVGTVADLEKCVSDTYAPATLSAPFSPASPYSAIAHTRWATHGPPCAINSHPHVSGPDHGFVVVHNGIITNFRAIKATLASHGYAFVTETDTEVIPKLLAYLYQGYVEGGGELPSLADLVAEVCLQLEGAFAILVKSSHYPDELVATKRGSPLILGLRRQEDKVGGSTEGTTRTTSPRPLFRNASVPREVLMHLQQNSHPRVQHAPENPSSLPDGSSSPPTRRASAVETNPEPVQVFFASDPAAVVEQTKEVVVLEDGDVVHAKQGYLSVFSLVSGSMLRVSRVTEQLQMELHEIMKGGYPHFMKKEIHEQPESLRQTMSGRVRFGRPSYDGTGSDRLGKEYVHLGGLLDQLTGIKRSRRLMFIACGTSYHAAVAARKVVEELSRIPVQLELASDLVDRQSPIFREDCCIFLSQSGETADTLVALEYAKRSGALCIGITNTVGSAIARQTNCGVNTNAGAEIGVASTKAYTSQITCIVMMAVKLAEDTNSVQDRLRLISNGLLALPDAVHEALKLDGEMETLASRLAHSCSSILIFGRGHNYATALEGALKIKEISYIHSEGLLAGEMKHGPLGESLSWWSQDT